MPRVNTIQNFAPLADEASVGQYITFRVARQEFAMDATRLRGLLPIHELVPLDAPQGQHPEWICGIASIRGRDFPVVGLRGKLGVAHGSHGRQPCIVAVEVASADGPRLVGFIADSISEVLTLRERDVLDGVARIGGRPRRVFDPDQLLLEAEIEGLWRPAPHAGA